MILTDLIRLLETLEHKMQSTLRSISGYIADGEIEKAKKENEKYLMLQGLEFHLRYGELTEEIIQKIKMEM